MYHFVRPRTLSLIVNPSKNVFRDLKYSGSLTVILPIIKANRLHLAFFPIRTHGSTLTSFASKKESCIETNQTYVTTNQDASIYIEQLSRVLHCSEEEVHNLYHNHEQIAELNISDINIRVEKLHQYGIEDVTIKQNILIILFTTYQLTARLELLKKWKFTNINNAVCILQLPFTQLQKLTFKTKHDFKFFDNQNKITYFSSFVECHEKEACELFVKYPFMMTLNVEALKSILTMAKDVGVETKDLLSDPWLFRYNPQFIATRIQLLDEIDAKEKCKVIKPWMLRCPQNTLDRYFELKDENMAALGSYTNLKDLLSNELDLSDSEVEGMFFKHPPLAKISYSKAKEMIDFLKAEGFGSNMIYQVPRVLCHKQATLLARMLELKKVNPRMMSLQNLCRNKKDYLAFLNKVQGPLS